MQALTEVENEGYIRSIGLTQLSADKLERAAKVHPVKLLEMDYSLVNRSIESNGVLDTARRNGIETITFGVLCHGLLSDSSPAWRRPGLSPEFQEQLLGGLRKIAAEKDTTVEKLAQAYVYAKNPDMSVLIGTTRKEHLQDAIDALSLDLSAEDVSRIEAAFPSELVSGLPMRNMKFRDGRVVGR